MAILGVLLAYTVWSLGSPPSETWSEADRALARGMDILVDNKFLTIFAWLFGVGLAQQWRRWEAAGYDPIPFHLRRMGFLFGVGLLHATFLRNGDILAPYALLGLALLGFRRRRTWALASMAVLLALAPYLMERIVPAVGLAWPERPSGSAGNYFADNLAWLRYWYVTNPFLSWPRVLALMIAGFLAGRAGLIERMATRPALSGVMLTVALPLAVVARWVLAGLEARWTGRPFSPAQGVTLDLLHQVSSWTLAATYAAALLLVSQGAARSYLSPLRALGRMAFTNYLLQALVVVPVCLVFGLFDKVTPTRGVWMALVLGALQLGLSTWWLRRHPMGPFERIWRGVTYGFGRPAPATSTR